MASKEMTDIIRAHRKDIGTPAGSYKKSSNLALRSASESSQVAYDGVEWLTSLTRMSCTPDTVTVRLCPPSYATCTYCHLSCVRLPGVPGGKPVNIFSHLLPSFTYSRRSVSLAKAWMDLALEQALLSRAVVNGEEKTGNPG